MTDLMKNVMLMVEDMGNGNVPDKYVPRIDFTEENPYWSHAIYGLSVEGDRCLVSRGDNTVMRVTHVVAY